MKSLAGVVLKGAASAGPLRLVLVEEQRFSAASEMLAEMRL
jgi:hypothetical protein